jgi:serine/threonine-protein phosphatase 2A regulatory subunit B
LSSDEVQTFLWNYEKGSNPYMVGNLLGDQKIEDITENINFSKAHPTSNNMFMYGTNKGNLKLCDLRQASNPDNTAINFKSECSGKKSFIT